MPNFHTHWLVALQALDGLPAEFAWLKAGRSTYVVQATQLGDAVREQASDVLKRRDLDAANALQKSIENAVKAWEDGIRDDEDAIAFSAYMLGACGPDFWTLPSVPEKGMKPDVASHHFDLGHYNRTHSQFHVSLGNVAARTGIDAKVEQAYFLGMATHVGGDLVLHQLVNVSAGAYDLLKSDPKSFLGQELPTGTWSNEQGFELLSPGDGRDAKTLGDVVTIWTTHNKVEHYWDTWVRYRWLGDFGDAVWKDDVRAAFNGFTSPRLPLCDTLRRDLLGREGTVSGLGTTIGHNLTRAMRAMGRAVPRVDHSANLEAAVKDRVDYVLGSVETKWLLEKPLAFPWLFADAVLSGRCEPFIYDRVVWKAAGAYPEALTYPKAKEEAEKTWQMKDLPTFGRTKKKLRGGSGGRPWSEKRKLQFFSTERNRAMVTTSWNFLNYLVCPNLERLRKFGDDKFYERAAFAPFVASAAGVARSFAGELATAYTQRRRRVARLARHWNLDTGLGVHVQNVKSGEGHQVLTRIDWIHVLGPDGGAPKVEYVRTLPPRYTQPPFRVPEAQEPYPLSAWKEDDRAFGVYPGPEFERLGDVAEPDSVKQERKYMDRIRLRHPVAASRAAPILERMGRKYADNAAFEQALFEKDEGPRRAAVHPVPSGKEVEAKAAQAEHRLDLIVRASIARLGHDTGPTNPTVAMYLLGDSVADDARPPVKTEAMDDLAAPTWLRKHSKILDRVTKPDPSAAADAADLATFSARIIVNAPKKEGDKPSARAVARGDWNNVVPHEPNKAQYGRNFAVATARTHVLRGETGPREYNFDATKHFKQLSGLGLTEHCFFTLYPLVRTEEGWIDAFSKKKVESKEQFAELKKIDAINFVKIVLLYVLDGGLQQLPWCYVDGIRHRVPTVGE